MDSEMRIIGSSSRTGFRRLPVLPLLFMLFLIPLPRCKKTPISPDASILERPVIWLNTSDLSFTASEAGPIPAAQELRIKNSGKNSLKYTISDDAPWLTISPSDGSSTGQVVGHTVAVDATGMSGRDADYTATITVTCGDAYNNPQTVAVALKLSKEPPPQISVAPASLSFGAQVGGSNPSPQTITVKNSGQSVLNYTISDDASWLDVSPASGSSSGETKSHTVAVNSTGLAVGSYTAMITVSDSRATNNPQTVSVSLQISQQPPPTIAVNRASLSFSAQAGGGNPSPQAIGIRNAGGGTLSYSVTWDAAWLSVAPASGSSTGQENAHVVSVNSGGLSQGSYSGTITITSSGAVNSPQTVGIALQITPAGGANQIGVSCSPSQAQTGTTVSFPIDISGNSSAISSFGVQLTFDTNMFDYVGTSKGSLTGSWTYIDGNASGGTVTVGGFAGSGSAVGAGSSGTIAVVTLKVTGGSYSDGKQSVVSISSYADDISGMKPEPATTTFTYKK